MIWLGTHDDLVRLGGIVPEQTLNRGVAGGDGNDVLDGRYPPRNQAGDPQQGDNAIIIGESYDLRGDAGNDVIFGSDGAARLDGGIGDDRIVAGFGSDSLYGGDGDDQIDARAVDPVNQDRRYVYGGAGTDGLLLTVCAATMRCGSIHTARSSCLRAVHRTSISIASPTSSDAASTTASCDYVISCRDMCSATMPPMFSGPAIPALMARWFPMAPTRSTG